MNAEEIDLDATAQWATRKLNEFVTSYMAEREGIARQALWTCEDGYIVGYTTQRIEGGPLDGRFALLVYKPVGAGSRGGRKQAAEWVLVQKRAFSTRKAAKARASTLYYRHSPKAAVRHGVVPDPAAK